MIAAAAGTLALTWSDCGGAHGTTKDVQPTTITLGQTTDVVGTGTTDKAITGGTYDMHITAGGGLINKHFTGNNCEAKEFDLPLGIGKLSWAGIDCPLAAGDTELHFSTQLAGALPASMAKSDISMTAVDQDGESALCVNIHMEKQDSLASAGSCSADDQAKLADAKTVGEKQNKCGQSALGLTGINHDKFVSCVQSELSISSSCSECYYTVADYGFKNCKAACLLGWCKSGCLSCTQPAQDDLPACTGFSPAVAEPCLESTATGSCSADDQANLADAKTVGEKQNKCGQSALGLTGINHDKFVSCVQSELSISSSCSECYYTVADYGFKNCKAACLLGWCKSGCLSCTQPAQDDLPACTGFSPAVAEPCLESTTTGSCSADDQANLADAKTVGEKQNKCGQSALGLTGINHDKFVSCVQSELSISSSCSECYYTVADYGFKNCKAACLLGWCKSGCLSCTQPAQDDLPACTGFSPAVAEPCLESTATGSCSADDQANLADAKTVGEKQNKCGQSALKLTGIDHDSFVSCVQSELSISSACSECYYTVADYGFKNCKAACLLGWCKSGCLSCTQPAQDDLPACTGFSPAVAEPCMDGFLA